MWKLPKNAIDAQNAAVAMRREAVRKCHDMMEDGHDPHTAYLLLVARLAEINAKLNKPIDGTTEIF